MKNILTPPPYHLGHDKIVHVHKVLVPFDFIKKKGRVIFIHKLSREEKYLFLNLSLQTKIERRILIRYINFTDGYFLCILLKHSDNR